MAIKLFIEIKNLDMKKNLIIIGASGHGKVVADIAERLGHWNEIYFLDDDESIKSLMEYKVIGTSKDITEYVNDSDFFVAIGKNETRMKIQELIEEVGGHIVSLVHPNAVIGKNVNIGVGTVVMAGAVINAATNIGKGCIINTGATIDHDCQIGDYVHVSPGVNVAGTVKVGNLTWLGIGSKVSNNLTITNNCVIGAGAVVVKDIKKSGTYIGVPARRI